MAAGVAVGQRVVLGEDGDGRAGPIGLAGLGAKCGLQSRHAALDHDPHLTQRAGEQPGREALLELQLGMGMDLAAKPDRLVLEAID